MTESRLHNHVDLSGNAVALFGMAPRGHVLATRAVREGVSLISNITELRNLAVQASSGASQRFHSIIIVACTGDDFSGIPAIYNLAVELHILVTIIMITRAESGHTDTNGILSASSDIIVISPDETCLQYMLDLIVG